MQYVGSFTVSKGQMYDKWWQCRVAVVQVVYYHQKNPPHIITVHSFHAYAIIRCQ